MVRLMRNYLQMTKCTLILKEQDFLYQTSASTPKRCLVFPQKQPQENQDSDQQAQNLQEAETEEELKTGTMLRITRRGNHLISVCSHNRLSVLSCH